MLILSRKKDEIIVIDENIYIQIVDIKSDSVKIGITAPQHIKVFREEVWKNIQEENTQAAIKDSGSDIKEKLQHIQKQLTSKSEKEKN